MGDLIIPLTLQILPTNKPMQTTEIIPDNQLTEGFNLIHEFIDFLDSKQGEIKPYPDLPEDFERLQELIAQAKDGLTNLAESVDS